MEPRRYHRPQLYADYPTWLDPNFNASEYQNSFPLNTSTDSEDLAVEESTSEESDEIE
jgi:hypothetical protein